MMTENKSDNRRSAITLGERQQVDHLVGLFSGGWLHDLVSNDPKTARQARLRVEDKAPAFKDFTLGQWEEFFARIASPSPAATEIILVALGRTAPRETT
jgi:hypothetical protein